MSFVRDQKVSCSLLWGTELDIENDGKAPIVPGATRA